MKQVAIAFDQLINTLLGGYADETLSARAHRMRVKKSLLEFGSFVEACRATGREQRAALGL